MVGLGQGQGKKRDVSVYGDVEGGGVTAVRWVRVPCAAVPCPATTGMGPPSGPPRI